MSAQQEQTLLDTAREKGVLAVMDTEIRRACGEAYQAGRDLIEARATVAELMKVSDQLLVAIRSPGLVKPSAKNANAGFVDMRDWYALMAGVNALHAALARVNGEAK